MGDAVDVDADPVFQRAHAALSKAETVLFLGFGFDPVNVGRLKPEVWNKAARKEATRLGMTNEEWLAVNKLIVERATEFSNWFVAHSGSRIVEFLRETFPLR